MSHIDNTINENTSETKEDEPVLVNNTSETTVSKETDSDETIPDETVPDETTEESDCLCDNFPLTENSDLYVVSVDGRPRFYVKDEKAAHEKMWNIARHLSRTQFFAGYKTNFLRIRENELHLLGSYRFFLIAYDTTLHRITYNRVQECT